MAEADTSIAWPADLIPGEAYVHAHNEILIPAAPEIIWAWLCRAPLWPQWYSNCGGFKFDSGGGPDLTPGAQFTWNTFGATVHSTVRRFEAPRQLEWDASTRGIRAYHGWVISPRGNHCRVVTEETQTGLLPFWLRWFLRGLLQRGHQIWLKGLKSVTARGVGPYDSSTTASISTSTSQS